MSIAILLNCSVPSVGILHDVLLSVKRNCKGNIPHIQIQICARDQVLMPVSGNFCCSDDEFFPLENCCHIDRLHFLLLACLHDVFLLVK